jgi:hypothetical protein
MFASRDVLMGDMEMDDLIGFIVDSVFWRLFDF